MIFYITMLIKYLWIHIFVGFVLKLYVCPDYLAYSSGPDVLFLDSVVWLLAI